ncbi:endonuclease/exonuclease/phosphatase family protein [Sporosarcina cascadiensis]|uniref:endonuclease/exonuclease/phosphatase family protein n=1 Tax=Sporosarcina cascadiensis TaxID=2660747 RepID=UPI00129B0826|nr:endonuclease/exonuclease/phosphatase family protein [Sporosarcina cascadiensis]
MTGYMTQPVNRIFSSTCTEQVHSLRVMSFNIAHGMGMDGRVDLRRTAEVIENSGADIIGLQEVDNHFSERSGFTNQVADLARWLGMNYSYGANVIEPPLLPGLPARQYGNALLSRFPIKYTKNHLYTKASSFSEDPELRGLLESTIDLGGTFLSFFNTHLSLGEKEQRENLKQLLAITNDSVFPAVITGDFNLSPEHPQLSEFRKAYTDSFSRTGMETAYTFPAYYEDVRSAVTAIPASRIDYIFTDQSTIIEKTEVLETSAADHLPIIADLLV